MGHWPAAAFGWPLATASPEDTVTQIFSEKFADEVHELSGGKMKIQVYANSTLGGDRELLETCADGDIPCGAAGHIYAGPCGI